MKLELTTVAVEREKGGFCNPVIKWGFRITTGSRCHGLISANKYTCPLKAMDAGNRMIKKLQGKYE